jgi:hypothetical protein
MVTGLLGVPSCWSRGTATGWPCTRWPRASVGTSPPRASRSSRWAGSATRGHSRRDTGRRGSAPRWLGSTTPPRRPSSGTGWRREGSAPPSSLTDYQGLGFYRCSADLEDELIHALGVECVEAVIEAAGEEHSLRLLTGMPAQRDWTREAVLRRFRGVRSGRRLGRRAAAVRCLLRSGSRRIWATSSVTRLG